MEDIKGSLDALTHLFTTRMSAFELDLQKMSPARNPTVSTLMQDFDRFRTFVMSSFADIQSQISILNSECDDLEMRTRREMLLLHGVPEKEEDNIVEVVADILKTQLHLKEFGASDLCRAHRIGRAGEKPRPILVKFRGREVRDEAWYSKTRLKGTGFTISEFLTGRRHKLFKAARLRLGITKCWTREGRIFGLDGKSKRHSITSLADLDRLGPPVEAHGELPSQPAAARGREPAPTKSKTPSTRRGRGLPAAK